MHEKHFIPDNFINITGEQVIDQSEKDAIPSIFDYPFHLVKTMHEHIDIVLSEVLLKLCFGKGNPSQRPKLNSLILFGND